MTLDFYDIAAETCGIDEAFAKRLGFKKIFVLGKEIMPAGRSSENETDLSGKIAFGKGEQLISLAKHGAPAVAITDAYIDRKLMEIMRDNGCMLCIPMSIITASYGIERSRNIYRISKLYAYARKMKIDVIFVSMAKSPAYLNSCMQLVELAKLVGADEKYARLSISTLTKSIVKGNARQKTVSVSRNQR